MPALELIDAQVRDTVRRRGLDPAADPDAVRRVVDETVKAYDERSLTGAVPALSDIAGMTRDVFDAVAGFGPLQRYLDDDTVEEIWINEPGRIFIARHGRTELTTTLLSPQAVRDLVERMLKPSGRRLDLSTPFVDALLPDGSRLHVVIPDITREHWALNIRKFIVRANHLDDLVDLGAMTQQVSEFLEAAVIAGLNIVVAGGTQAGKTTLLNCLAAAIPARERVIVCEEVFELSFPLPDVVAMQTRQASLEGTGEIRLRRLVKEALRMRPDRIIVGEVRQEECLDLLLALNSGVPGLATVHANSARDAVTKLCMLPLLAAENVTSAFIVPTVAASLDIVVFIRRDASGTRRISDVSAVPGRCEDGVIEVESIFRTEADALVRADGYPPHADRFARSGYDLASLLAPDETTVSRRAQLAEQRDRRGPA